MSSSSTSLEMHHATEALWDIGITDVRVPLEDLMDDRRASAHARLDAHRPSVCRSCPPASQMTKPRTMIQFCRSSCRWEIVLPRSQLQSALPALADLSSASGRPVSLAVRQTLGERPEDQTYGKYFIGHGFTFGESGLIESLLEHPLARAAISRLVFGLSIDAEMSIALPEVDRLAHLYDVDIDVVVFFSDEHPDKARTDHVAVAHQVAAATITAHAFPRISLFFDTFIDMDRGYFPRHGLIDRRCNLGPAGYAVKVVHEAMAGVPRRLAAHRHENAGPRITASLGSGRSVVLVDRGPASFNLNDLGPVEPITGLTIHAVVEQSDRTVAQSDRIELPTGGPYLIVCEHPTEVSL